MGSGGRHKLRRMPRVAKSLFALLGAFVLAATLTTAAIGRNALDRGAAADAEGCAQIGGEFHPEAWRAPAEFFAGYHCIFPVVGAAAPASAVEPRHPVGRQMAEQRRCETVHHGQFMTIAVAAYTGYACTWLRTP
jgi:hypothetical protein